MNVCAYCRGPHTTFQWQECELHLTERIKKAEERAMKLEKLARELADRVSKIEGKFVRYG